MMFENSLDVILEVRDRMEIWRFRPSSFHSFFNFVREERGRKIFFLVMLSIRMEPKIIVTARCVRCGEENDSDSFP